MGTKVCTKCNVGYPIAYFSKRKDGKDGLHIWCKRCLKEYQKQYHLRNYERINERHRQYYKENPAYAFASSLKQLHNITTEQYNKMLKEQNGVCAICGKPETKKDRVGKTQRLSVDHNHNTNKVRGLLCQKCNSILGMAGVDNYGIELLCSAISYIKNTDGLKVVA